MAQSYDVRLYQSGDEQRITPLLQQVFNGWITSDVQASPVDHWKWLYFDNPEKINPSIVAEKEGEIIGVHHGLYYKTKVGDNMYLSYKGTDTAVSPKARGMGVYTELKKANDKMMVDLGTALRCGYSSNPIIIAKNKENPGGFFLFPKPVKTLFRIKNIDLHMSKAQKQRSELDKTLVKPGYKTLLFINKINKYLKTTDYKDSKIEIKKVTKFDDRINVFWDVVKNHYDYIVTKNEKYLNWRYCDPRGGPYQIYVAEEDNKIVGYIVFRLNTTQKDYPEGYIVEVLALPKRLDAVDMLVKKVVNDFDAMKVNVVNAMLVYGNQYEVVLGKHDFLYNRDKVGVSFTPMKLGDVDLAKFNSAPPNRLNYQWGESDTI